MNDQQEQALKVAVERIVRPVVAPEQTKLKMRRELLAHAIEAFEVERCSAPNQAGAVRKTIERLGDAEQTRRELQGTVSLLDRADWLAERFFRQQPGGSLVVHALKVALAAGSALALLWVGLFTVVVFFAANHQQDVRVVPVVVAAYLMALIVFLPTVLLTKACWLLVPLPRTDLMRCCRSLGLLVVSFLLPMVVIELLTLINGSSWTLLDNARICVAFFIGLTPIALLTVLLDLWRRRGTAEWVLLDLDAAVAE